jgi:hypothetical protein
MNFYKFKLKFIEFEIILQNNLYFILNNKTHYVKLKVAIS